MALVTTSKALVTSSDALVTTSFLLLLERQNLLSQFFWFLVSELGFSRGVTAGPAPQVCVPMQIPVVREMSIK